MLRQTAGHNRVRGNRCDRRVTGHRRHHGDQLVGVTAGRFDEGLDRIRSRHHHGQAVSQAPGVKLLERTHSVKVLEYEHLKLDVVEEQRFRSGALTQILVPRR